MKTFHVALWAALTYVTTAGPIASAQQRVGNGGDAVVCKDEAGEITSARLLDFFEAEIVLRDWSMADVALAAAVDPVDKAVHALRRIERFDTLRAARYVAKAQRFREGLDARFAEVDLRDIDDSAHLIDATSERCAIKQLAIQSEPMVPENFLYLVDSRIWRKLSPDDQAGLIVHEVLYGEAIERRQPDSVMVRYLTSQLVTDRLESMTSEQYVALFDRAGFNADHWREEATRYRWALLGRAPRTWAEANAACRRLGGEYKLATIRQLWNAHPAMSGSWLGTLIAGDGGTDMARASSLIWSSSPADDAGGQCGRQYKVLVFPHDIGAATSEPLCETATTPLTLCMSERWVDADLRPNEPAQGAEPNPNEVGQQDNPPKP